MKKYLQKAMLLIVVGTCCFTYFVGCGEKCSHFSKTFVEHTATCDNAGVARYKCDDCGIIIEEEREALGHDYSILVNDTATCVAAGLKTNKCSRCDSTQEVFSAIKEHNYKPVKCEICGKVSSYYDKVTVSYSSGEYTYRKKFQYVIGYTIYELSCGVKISNASKTAEFFISGNLKMFVGERFYPYIYDDNNRKLGSGGIMLTTANTYYASRNIELTRVIQAGEICYFSITE